ncbi:NAD(P)-dependent alcohol dehydrogenase [Maritalea porphyrae]|uniref:NAD(P)-dependent alcohol dehydrogenase n=1 Tax=Maritalea porphyrae TaxID=880732 RepID=UPI0022AE6DD2|nr:NAD(P)-dependent alcohol dehydrogenase [Maritalea porphyrae]MCZ4273428.1 NAD(P)-dependent alcohol dehydrogenase [Maritalea porphyrae]
MAGHMKAAIFTKYGPPQVLVVQERAMPVPSPTEVLVKVHCGSVTTADVLLRSNDVPWLFWLPMRLMLGFFKMKHEILGNEFAGEVVSIGKSVTRFKPGDIVCGRASFGSNAQYRTLGENSIMRKLPTLDHMTKSALFSFGGMTALQTLRDIGNLRGGERVLVIGAGGACGTMAVQIAGLLGAHVTGVCSKGKKELVLALGADEVIDYASEDYTLSDRTYDVIFDAVGNRPASASWQVLAEGGRYLSLSLSARDFLWSLISKLNSNKRHYFGTSKPNQTDYDILCDWFLDGKINPIVDKVFPLSQIARAHSYVQTGRKTGNVGLEMEHTHD